MNGCFGVFPLAFDFSPCLIRDAILADSHQSSAVGTRNRSRSTNTFRQAAYFCHSDLSIVVAVSSYKTTEDKAICAMSFSVNDFLYSRKTFISKTARLMFWPVPRRDTQGIRRKPRPISASR